MYGRIQPPTIAHWRYNLKPTTKGAYNDYRNDNHRRCYKRLRNMYFNLPNFIHINMVDNVRRTITTHHLSQ